MGKVCISIEFGAYRACVACFVEMCARVYRVPLGGLSRPPSTPTARPSAYYFRALEGPWAYGA